MKKGKHEPYNKYKRKNLMYRAKPWLIIFVCLLAAAGIAYGIYYFISTRPVEIVEEVVYEEVDESSFPTLTMEYNGRQINELYAYSADMDLNYAAQAIYLLEDTYEIPVEIELNGCTVSSLEFYIYNMETSSLIQNGTASELSTADGVLSASLVIDQIISNDTEYVLDIVLTLKDSTTLHFYTRVLRASGTYIADEIDLAFTFSEATVTGDEDVFSSYMETNPWTQSNNNFSGVNLKSSIKQMMWQGLEVELLDTAKLTITDINNTIGCFTLEYVLTRQDGDTTEYYRVSEYFRIRMTDTNAYILSYERTVDEIFIPSQDLLSTSSVELGILSSADLETAASSDGYYSCFVNGGTLWEMDSSAKELVRIFSFETDDAADTDSRFYDHDIEILSVGTNGDVEFLVYGYMNAGAHEGLCGVGLYQYSASAGEVTEELFIQADVPYEILKETTGDMVYVSEAEILYILIDQILYSVTLDSYKTEIIAEGLASGSYSVSLEENIIAWQEDGKINDASKITIFNAETGKKTTVKAGSGSSIKILGFIGDDLVYGTGDEGNYYYDDSDEEYLLMGRIFVKNSDGTIENEYISDSGYFISAQYEYNRIIIEKNEGESLTVYSSQITAVSTPEVSSEYDDTKEYIYYVEFIKSTTTSGDFTITLDVPVYVTDADLVVPSGFLDLSGRYLVYGKGSLVLITASASEAVTTAYEYEGYVKDEEGYFYRRGMRASSISMSESNIEKALEQYESGDLTVITGITLTQAFYFTGESIALIWEYAGETYIIYGYDSGDDLLLYNVETGETSEMSNEDAQEAFENSDGSLYVAG